MGVREWTAIALGKGVGNLTRSLGRGAGSALPGVIALTVAPRLLGYLARQLTEGVVLITGTNGKTTTARMLASILQTWGKTPIANPTGSNLLRGLTSALVQRASLTGCIPHGEGTIGLFEVDEAVLPYAVRELVPKAVVVHNLFRDQLDRYGEVDQVVAIWREAVKHLSLEATVVLNADDPAVASLGEEAPGRVLYYGVEDTTPGSQSLQHAADSKWCLKCGESLDYDVAFYGHLGHYCCRRCGSHRPLPEVSAQRIVARGLKSSNVTVSTPEGPLSATVNLPGLYNVYNALGATAAAVALGVPLEVVGRGLASFTAAFGRFERVEMEGRTVYLVLAKNPAGFNQALRALFADQSSRGVVFFLNDRQADGLDISWIWDVDFELVVGYLPWVVVSGLRAEDMALRLKYAGLDGAVPLVVEPDLGRAVLHGLERTALGEDLYLVPTYTAMLDVRRWLSEKGYMAPYWGRE